MNYETRITQVTIPEIESAWLNVQTAERACTDAFFQRGNWPETLLLINTAIKQLEAARGKIERHVAQMESGGNDKKKYEWFSKANAGLDRQEEG